MRLIFSGLSSSSECKPLSSFLLLPMSTYVYTVYRGILRAHGCFKLSLCLFKHSLDSGLSTREVKVECQIVSKQILTLLNSGEARGALWASVILSVLTDAAARILHYLFFLPFLSGIQKWFWEGRRTIFGVICLQSG